MDQDRTEEPQIRVVDRRWWARGDAGEQPDDESASRKPTYVEDLEQQLADARSRLQELMTSHRQSVDEFEQVRARLRRDVSREVERGRRAVLAEFLEIVDNLDRAIAATGETPGDAVAQLTRGVALVREQCLSKLGAFGVKRVPALGQPFDAQRHEAVTTMPVSDAAQDGLVVAVLKEGYAINDDILRPASVVVGTIATDRH